MPADLRQSLRKVVVAQMGARLHYALPVQLERMGVLAHFYTDTYGGKGWPRLARLIPERLRPAGLKRVLARSAEIPASKVTAFNYFGLEYYRRQRQAKTRSQSTEVHLWAGETFDRLILKSSPKEMGTIHAMESAALGLFQREHRAGVKCILEKCSAPREVYDATMEEEIQLWPGWEVWEQDGKAREYRDRIIQECDLADVIVTPSTFVMDGLAKCSISRAKCRLVPYGIDTDRWSVRAESKRPTQKLKVFYAGRVQLMKGIQYLLQAAACMDHSIELRIAGAIHCSRERLLAHSPANTQYLGHIPRTEVQRHYHWADVFCLPSLSEGSAGVVYEALASGLPVICTPNTGSVVRDNVDGFIVPMRSSEAIVAKMELLLHDRDLLAEMSQNARRTAESHSLHRYGERLIAATQLQGNSR